MPDADTLSIDDSTNSSVAESLIIQRQVRKILRKNVLGLNYDEDFQPLKNDIRFYLKINILPMNWHFEWGRTSWTWGEP